MRLVYGGHDSDDSAHASTTMSNVNDCRNGRFGGRNCFGPKHPVPVDMSSTCFVAGTDTVGVRSVLF